MIAAPSICLSSCLCSPWQRRSFCCSYVVYPWPAGSSVAFYTQHSLLKSLWSGEGRCHRSSSGSLRYWGVNLPVWDARTCVCFIIWIKQFAPWYLNYWMDCYAILYRRWWFPDDKPYCFDVFLTFPLAPPRSVCMFWVITIVWWSWYLAHTLTSTSGLILTTWWVCYKRHHQFKNVSVSNKGCDMLVLPGKVCTAPQFCSFLSSTQNFLMAAIVFELKRPRYAHFTEACC